MNRANSSSATWFTPMHHLVAGRESGVLNACLERPETISCNLAGWAITDGCEIDFTDTCFSRVGLAPLMLVGPSVTAASGPIIDHYPAVLGQERVVHGMARHFEGLGSPRTTVRSPTSNPTRAEGAATRDSLPWRLGRFGRVLVPHMRAARAPVTTCWDQRPRTRGLCPS